jgi:serine/threonine protein kinase
LEKVDLDRYELTGRLGVGADYEVRAATDRETGNQVAIKRPVPQAISRNQHEAIESRTEKLLQAYQEIGVSTDLISPIVGYTERALHDDFFGDELGKEYQVFIEERATGIPLLGDMMSKFKGVPIGAGQNLFALFPLVQASGVAAHPVHNQLLDLEEVYLSAGYIILDLRPQNIFYQPGSGQIVLIDTGALVRLDGDPPRGRPPFDINDACLEILKFYTTATEPPAETTGYRDPKGIRPIVNIGEELDEMARDMSATTPSIIESGTVMLNKIRERGYTEYSQFRSDLNTYLDRIDERNSTADTADAATQTWQEAAQWLKEDYWRGFLFDPDLELASFLA